MRTVETTQPLAFNIEIVCKSVRRAEGAERWKDAPQISVSPGSCQPAWQEERKGKGCCLNPVSAVLLRLWEHPCRTAAGTTTATTSREASSPSDGAGFWEPAFWLLLIGLLLLLELLLVFWCCCYDHATVTATCVACDDLPWPAGWLPQPEQKEENQGSFAPPAF